MKKILKCLALILALTALSPISVLASENNPITNDLQGADDDQFEELIKEITNIKYTHPEYQEEEILSVMNQQHSQLGQGENARGLTDIWNALTESEKKLCIRYPFAALKVNTAKNIAISQTEEKFGISGLGDKSDAFRHGLWNAEMTVLIGKDKAELFATAHEDKDVTGTESDGYLKTSHRDMDLHNNEVGREIGEKNSGATEDEMGDIVYNEVFSESTRFIWLHD